MCISNRYPVTSTAREAIEQDSYGLKRKGRKGKGVYLDQ
jgi:hypothetical protein